MIMKLKHCILQDMPTSSLIEDDATSEASVADMSRFIPKIPSSPSVSHIISIGKLLESVIFSFPFLLVACGPVCLTNLYTIIVMSCCMNLCYMVSGT